VQLIDVTLRDGLQAQSLLLSIDQKFKLFQALEACGFPRIEITSFVSPKWIPQFADSEALCEKVFQKKTTASTMAFVPNLKGLERFLKFPIDWVAAFTTTSETFSQKNINMSVDKSLEELAGMVQETHSKKRKFRLYISTVFGCPYEGEISTQQRSSLFKKVASLGADEIALGDTIGVATPKLVHQITREFQDHFPLEKLVMHFHNTYGSALANVQASLEAGVENYDASMGGVGGCPYAKGASGNLAMDDLSYFLFRQGLIKEFPVKKFESVLDLLKQAGIELYSQLSQIHAKGGRWFAAPT